MLKYLYALIIIEIPDLHGQLLKDLLPEVMEYISLEISDKNLKGWKEIGRKMELANEQLRRIRISSEHDPKQLPGELLIEYLKASNPKLTVNEFIKALKSIERNDVIEYIYEKCRK